MRYPLSPIWLVVLYDIAGYSEAEIAELGDWSLKSIKAGLAEWKIPAYDLTPKGREIRKHIDRIRETQGKTAAMNAIANLLVEIAPPIRVYR